MTIGILIADFKDRHQEDRQCQCHLLAGQLVIKSSRKFLAEIFICKRMDDPFTRQHTKINEWIFSQNRFKVYRGL